MSNKLTVYIYFIVLPCFSFPSPNLIPWWGKCFLAVSVYCAQPMELETGLTLFKLHKLRREGGDSLNDSESTDVRKGIGDTGEANKTLWSLLCDLPLKELHNTTIIFEKSRRNRLRELSNYSLLFISCGMSFQHTYVESTPI